jgi:hypothetical protein
LIPHNILHSYSLEIEKQNKKIASSVADEDGGCERAIARDAEREREREREERGGRFQLVDFKSGEQND